MQKNPGCSGSIGDEKLPSYAGMNHYKDPYEATSILFVFFGHDKVFFPGLLKIQAPFSDVWR